MWKPAALLLHASEICSHSKVDNEVAQQRNTEELAGDETEDDVEPARRGVQG